jgi:hypothetical protein
MHGRTSDRDHQGDPRLPPVLFAWDSGCGWRVVLGLFGFQSQALPYLILGVVGNGGTFPDHSVTISDSVLSATVVHSGTLASALNDMRAGLATAMTATLFSPTSC